MVRRGPTGRGAIGRCRRAARDAPGRCQKGAPDAPRSPFRRAPASLAGLGLHPGGRADPALRGLCQPGPRRAGCAIRGAGRGLCLCPGGASELDRPVRQARLDGGRQDGPRHRLRHGGCRRGPSGRASRRRPCRGRRSALWPLAPAAARGTAAHGRRGQLRRSHRRRGLRRRGPARDPAGAGRGRLQPDPARRRHGGDRGRLPGSRRRARGRQHLPDARRCFARWRAGRIM